MVLFKTHATIMYLVRKNNNPSENYNQQGHPNIVDIIGMFVMIHTIEVSSTTSTDTILHNTDS